VYRCLHGQAPRYLADHLTPASDVASRIRLRSANRQQLLVPRCRLDTYGRQAFAIAGPNVWNSLPDELKDLKTRSVVLTVLNSSLRQSCSVSTNVTSALEVFLKRYALYKFTFYLLIYLLHAVTQTAPLDQAGKACRWP